MTEIYIKHHGILGQKWGVRRFQNPDGTLTERGKKRYGNKLDKVSTKTLRNQIKSYRDSGENGKNVKSLNQKVKDEVDSDKDVMRLRKFDDDLYNEQINYESEHENETLAWDQDTVDEYEKLLNEAIKSVNKIINSHIGDYSMATLLDLGYSYTESSKERVEKILRDMDSE